MILRLGNRQKMKEDMSLSNLGTVAFHAAKGPTNMFSSTLICLLTLDYFKCLQEKMDPKILSRILESLSSAIGLQQVRREAAIRAAPRSLTDQAKKRLRKIPFASQSLFGVKVDEIYKENTETNRGTLVHKAISNQAKSQNSSSQIHKPKSDQKKTTGPKSQPLSNREGKQFSQTPRSVRGGHFQRGSGSRVRAPSRRGASSSRKF